MSNLLKSRSYICENTETKVIDYNDVISEKIAKIQNEMRQEDFGSKNEGFVEGLKVEQALELVNDEESSEDVREEAQHILENAREEAQSIINRAKEESEILKQESANAGKEQGYKEGLEQAETEYSQMKQEIENQKNLLNQEYNKQLSEIEPKLVDAILHVFETVTHVLAEDDKEIVLNLVSDVLTKAEVSKEFLIKVSSEDYDYVVENREKLYSSVSKKVQMEIVEEPTLSKNQCIVESDSGIYNCSLDVQMKKLIRTIKTLSCMVE